MREWIIQAETIGKISDGYWYSNGEEIVRCKDCKHKGGFGCPWWKGEDIPTDWYCANGERMTDATD